MQYSVTIEQDEDGVYIAECPSLPGCVSQGGTRDDALTNVQDAVAGYIASLKTHGEPLPRSVFLAIVEVEA